MNLYSEDIKVKKLGNIYTPPKDGSWKDSNAICPTPYLISSDRLRIFVNMCTKENVGSIGYIDVSPDDPSHVIKTCSEPLLKPGPPGSFDDNGLGPISILKVKNKIFLYYIGFQKGVQVPYFMFCGLAISDDNGESFYRYSNTPVLDRYKTETHARCGCHVIYENGIFKMWYIGSIEGGWVTRNNKLVPLYTMRYIESEDGMNWYGEGKVCMNFISKDEHGFGRPHVWKEKNKYKMLYSIRTFSKGYKLGYAVSDDGINWDRRDEMLTIEGQNDLCYSHLFKYNNKTFMFCNKNDMGKTGVEYAILY